ncbi:MAG: hypothetical protein ABEJ95_02985 [Candidatus Nanohalobium sp.]
MSEKKNGRRINRDWKVFQTDVLDLVRQYEGFFDFFERVGSLSDNSRPDAFARITREEKKEIWVLDAKNKGSIDSEDEKRMEKYISQVERNPVDVGLELSELSEHELRGIFITLEEAASEFETVAFRRAHQFLQKELIYNDTNRIVRDVAKMAERKELSQSQARLLNRSLRPFRRRLEKVHSDLEELEEEFLSLKLYTPPFSSLEFSPPSDAVLQHSMRDGVFLVDVPYSAEEARKAERRARQLEEKIEQDAYYVSIHSFDVDSDFTCRPEEFKEKLRDAMGILSPEQVAELFHPRLQVEKNYRDGVIELVSPELEFRLTVKSERDVKHEVTAYLNEEAASRIKERNMNTRKELGELEDRTWKHVIEVGENLEIKHRRRENFREYSQTVKNIFHSSVNPVYSRKIAELTEK